MFQYHITGSPSLQDHIRSFVFVETDLAIQTFLSMLNAFLVLFRATLLLSSTLPRPVCKWFDLLKCVPLDLYRNFTLGFDIHHIGFLNSWFRPILRLRWLVFSLVILHLIWYVVRESKTMSSITSRPSSWCHEVYCHIFVPSPVALFIVQ